MTATYYVPADVTPLQRLKLRFIDGRKPLPDVPEHVQIQTVSGCNANCNFCPNQKTEIEIPYGNRMDWDLYRSIVDQCIDLGVKRFSPYLMNESMIDPELPERVAYITRHPRRKPFQFVKLVSHGGLLSERMAKGLLDAGIDRIHFSVQGIDPDVYFKIMQLKFEKTLRNIERLMELKEQGGYAVPKVRVLMLDTVEIHDQLPEIRAFWAERGIKIHVNQLENRGHHSKLHNEDIAVHDLQPFDWCKRMFNQIYILQDGRLVQCCADWEQSSIMGDLSSQRLQDIWMGDKYRDFRKRFLDGNVTGMLCDGCTKDAVGDEDE